MILFFDTETTGLPKDWKAPMSKLDNWPRVIQLAWLITDLKGEEMKRKELLIKPDGWIVPDGSDGTDASFWIVHGFSTATNEEKGFPMASVLEEFINDLQGCEYLVSHNMDYDHKVLGAEMLRYGMKAGRSTVKICTKDAATQFCKIPFAGQRDTRPWVKQKYKWPKLEELYLKLFGRDFEDKHQAGGDVQAVRDCFFELIALGVIELETLTSNP